MKKCYNCGADVPDNAKFCPKCGADAGNEEKSGTDQAAGRTAPEEQAGSGENMPGRKLPKKLIWIIAAAVVVAAVVVVLIIVLSNGKPTVDLNEYVQITETGYNGYGTASFTIEKSKIVADYARKIHLSSAGKDDPELKAYEQTGQDPVGWLIGEIGGSLNEDSGLSNGDEITFIWDINDSIETYLNVKLEYSDIPVTVEGLEEVETFDAYAGLSISFDGTPPDGTVIASADGQLPLSEFTIEPSSGLRNGDTVTVRLNNSLDYYVSKYGKLPAENEREYTVEGLINRFTFGCDYFSEDLDPSINVNSAWSLVRFGVGETLFKFDEDGAVQNNLCDEYATDDSVTWTLHIRDGVRFSNGRELTPSAIVDSWNMMYKEEEAGSSSAPSQYLPDPTFTADDSAGTITVVCNDITANLPGILAYPFFAVVDTEVLNHDDPDSVVGTGPYVMTGRVEATSKTFKRNENYWNGEVPYDEYTAVYITDSTTKAMAIRSGDVDVVENITNASDLDELKNDSAYTVDSRAGGRMANTYLNFNGVLGNESLRQAIMCAIDDETLCNVTVGGIYTPGFAVLPSSMDFGYDQLNNPYTYDLDRAKKILDDAGIVDTDGDGIREIDGENINLVYLTFESRQLQTFAEAISTTLNSIGIGVDYQVRDYDTVLDMQNQGLFDMVSSNAVIVPTGDPDAFLGNFYSKNSGGYGSYSNEQYDRDYEELITCTDEARRQELYVEMQQILIDDAATIVHGYYNSSFTYNNSVIKDVVMYPLDYTWVTKDWTPLYW